MALSTSALRTWWVTRPPVAVRRTQRYRSWQLSYATHHHAVLRVAHHAAVEQVLLGVVRSVQATPQSLSASAACYRLGVMMVG